MKSYIHLLHYLLYSYRKCSDLPLQDISIIPKPFPQPALLPHRTNPALIPRLDETAPRTPSPRLNTLFCASVPTAGLLQPATRILNEYRVSTGSRIIDQSACVSASMALSVSHDPRFRHKDLQYLRNILGTFIMKTSNS